MECWEETPMKMRIAIVTGGAGGIGRAISEALAAEGMTVVIADTEENEGKNIASALDGYFIKADLTQRSDCKGVVDNTLERYGRIDTLVNNAGIQHIDPIDTFPEDKWEQMIALILTAPFLLTKYAWPAMQEQKTGRIVNIASIHGLVASPYKAAYICAKHGLIGLTRAAALEGGEHGITVNAICPAYVRTPLVEGQVADQAKEHDMSEKDVVENIMLEDAAVKRLIEPDEVASMVVYLCSEKARSITGAALTIDLGWTAR
jgi:3-hydroxybutyrate dehydrogenase